MDHVRVIQTEIWTRIHNKNCSKKKKITNLQRLQISSIPDLCFLDQIRVFGELEYTFRVFQRFRASARNVGSLAPCIADRISCYSRGVPQVSRVGGLGGSYLAIVGNERARWVCSGRIRAVFIAVRYVRAGRNYHRYEYLFIYIHTQTFRSRRRSTFEAFPN